MRALFLTLLFLPFHFFSQVDITSSVQDESGAPLAGATVRITDTYMATFTDADGAFTLKNLPEDARSVTISYIGFEDKVLAIDALSSDMPIVLSTKAVLTQEVIVRSTRAEGDDPIAYSQLEKKELQNRNLGMDVPEVLNTSPSLYFTSDAGNGIGYTYLRLRGSDQTNINVTINGVPLNDAESQGVFWVDLPDLIASTDNIQIQRGVGTSTNGAGSFGGSINLLTSSSGGEPYASVDLGAGSFNTSKLSVGFGTGLLQDHFSLEGRFSRISSDGYMDRSAADLQSYFFTGGYQDKRTSIKLMLFGGQEVTQQAWWGVPRARLENDQEGMLAFAADNGWSEANTQNLLDSDRRFNYYTYDNEVDDYGQDHAQLHVSRRLSDTWSFNGALHYTKGKGFFEQFQDMDNSYDDTYFSDYGLSDPVIGTDTIVQADFIRRRWLDNDFYGLIASVSMEQGPWKVDLGGGANRYDGLHFGEVIWSSIAGDAFIRDRYYENTAVKDDKNVYVKANYAVNDKWNAYVDLQQRMIDYTFLGLLNDGSSADQGVSYAFFNPKLGLNFRPALRHRAFLSYGVAHKEPNRDDHVVSTPGQRPRAQRLMDMELGYAYTGQRIAAELVAYNMQYTDQLVNTGEVNDVGENVRTNVDDSFRRGVEVIVKARATDKLRLDANVGLSQNVIKDHVEYVYEYEDYSLVEQELGDVTIAYSPSVIFSSVIAYDLYADQDRGQRVTLNLLSKHVGEQYLDNTETAGRTIDAFTTHDLRLDVQWSPKWCKGLRLNLLARNVLDEEYVSNGWTYRYLYAGEEYAFDALFPQAGINFLAGLSVAF